ncbi:MAG TPA: hypothetical protein VKU40_04650, partial [Thermoanaerobaculia bacterium]|nr:hypothetical protein [Thermoanaerobaculia bacterium]
MRVRPLVPSLLVLWSAALLVAPALAEAQCQGSAQPLTSTTRSYECNVFLGTRPDLKWNFRVDCYDACGNLWNSLPRSPEALAKGACSVIPPTTCIPRFEQFNHADGLYATTNAWA